MRGPEAPVAGAEDGVTRRIHALLDPARTPGFDWRGELREGGHRKKVQAYGLSFAEKCLQAERFADARLLLEAYAQARRAAGLSEDPRALELHARVSAAAAAASKGEAAAADATGGGGRPSLSAQVRVRARARARARVRAGVRPKVRVRVRARVIPSATHRLYTSYQEP